MGDAGQLLMCALAWEPRACLVGNLTAKQVAEVAASALDHRAEACPKCGAEPGCNIDCEVCLLMPSLLRSDR